MNMRITTVINAYDIDCYEHTDNDADICTNVDEK